MGCCGQKRGKIQTQSGASSAQSTAPATVRIRSLHGSWVSYRGPSSDRRYIFTPSNPVRDVEAADAPQFLANEWFRRDE